MSIKRIYASKDCSISDVLVNNKRIQDSNDGASDSLQVFSIYGRPRSGVFEDTEKSRILIHFDMDEFIDFNSEQVLDNDPKYYLKLFDVKHHQTTPSNFTVVVNPLNSEFYEGVGLDQDNFTDKSESNWNDRFSGASWVLPGGDYNSLYEYTQTFSHESQNLSIDITELVELWLSDALTNNGIIIRISEDEEESTESFFKKKFSSRTSEYFFSQPIIERVDHVSTLNSSEKFSLRSSDSVVHDNVITFENKYFDNFLDVDSTNNIVVNFYTDNLKQDLLFSKVGSRIVQGFYSTSFSTDTEYGFLYIDWVSLDTTKLFKSQTIEIFDYLSYYSSEKIKINIQNFKKSYNTFEKIKFNLFTKCLTNKQNYYTKFIEEDDNIILNNMRFKLRRVVDGLIIFDYDHENNSTKLNWDSNGNWFKLDISLLEPNYMYELSFKNYNSELGEKFKFKATK